MIKTSAFGKYCVAFFCFGACIVSLINTFAPEHLIFFINSLIFLVSGAGFLVFMAPGYLEENTKGKE